LPSPRLTTHPTHPGLYVVTICPQHRSCVLDEIVDEVMEISPAGAMVQTVWEELPCAYPGVEIDAFVVMPNHVHDIVYLVPDQSERIRISGRRW
jgi:REP element-mobilizing transposase RayT